MFAFINEIFFSLVIFIFLVVIFSFEFVVKNPFGGKRGSRGGSATAESHAVGGTITVASLSPHTSAGSLIEKTPGMMAFECLMC